MKGDIGQVEAALASSLNTTAVPESLREQLFQSALEQPTIGPLPSTSPLPWWDTNQLARLQMVDPTIKCLIHFRNISRKLSAREMKAQTREAKQLLNQWHHIAGMKGVLYRSNADNHGNKHQQLLLPASLHAELFKGVHNQCGHQGLEKTEQLEIEHYWWPGLHNDVKKYLSECEHCVVAKDRT